MLIREIKTAENSDDERFWKSLIEVLREIIGVYEKANNLMSFGSVRYVRKTLNTLAISETISEGSVILDAGCGPGTSSLELIKILKDKGISFVGLDPIPEMLLFFKSNAYAYENVEFVRGVFEYLPFRDMSFSIQISSFAYRDAINYYKAANEFKRTLKQNGKFFMADLSKPRKNRLLLLVLTHMYIGLVPVIVGALLMGFAGMKLYGKLKTTYQRFLDSPTLYYLFKKVFGFTQCYYMLLNSVVICRSEKK